MNMSSRIIFKILIIISMFGSIGFAFTLLPTIIEYSSNDIEQVRHLQLIYYPIVFVFHFPFVYSLFQAWKLTNMLDNDKMFEADIISKLRLVKISGFIIGGLHLLAVILLLVINYNFIMGLLSGFVIVVSLIISSFLQLMLMVFERSNKIKLENDLTI